MRQTDRNAPVRGATRRRLGGLSLLLGASLFALAGCSDNGEANAASEEVAQATVPSATPAAPNAAPAAPQAITPAAEAPESQGQVDVAELMAPGPLADIVMGDPNAPVTIVEYASMTCVHCADFHINSLPAIKRDYIDTGKAKLILREFPFDARALAAFMLARCAEGDRHAAMVDVLFKQQEQWSRAENASEALLGIARLAGFSQESFTACLQNTELQGQIVAVKERGETEFGVAATPTFFVNGDKYSGSLPPEQMAAVIEAHL